MIIEGRYAYFPQRLAGRLPVAKYQTTQMADV
jgi:hypothetical protein